MSWLRRLVNTLRLGRLQRDIDREIAFHIREREEDLHADGVSMEEARLRARLQFGNPLIQRERTQDVDVARWLETSWRNVRHAVRGLVHAPGFSLTVVLTLALGIGANSAVFSAMDAVLLQPLPFRDPNRLMSLTQSSDATGESTGAAARILDWSRLSTTFQGITGHVIEDVSDTTGDQPERVQRATVLPGFLEVWSVDPLLGRGFTDAEHHLGGPAAILISERYWRRRFGADPQVVGKNVRMANRAYPIVGVLPASFMFPERDVDWWAPDWVDAPWAVAREFRGHTAIGRLKPGLTLEQARSELGDVQRKLAEQYPKTDRGLRPVIVPLKETYVAGVRGSLWLVFGAVSVLLTIACTNIASLLLARATRREQEIAVRYSLGASRATVIAQLLTESAVLAFAGGAVGLLVAAMAPGAFRLLAPGIPRLEDAALNARMLLYTVASAVIVALVCGLMPALRSTRGGAALGGSGRTEVSDRHSLQWLLVGVQMTLAVTLLTGAGLLLRSFDKLSRVDTGFNASHVLTFRVSATFGEDVDYNRTVQRINRTLDALRALPGVQTAATTLSLSGLPGEVQLDYRLTEGRAGDAPMIADARVVSPEYFETMQIPFLSGEPCKPTTTAAGTTEVIVNRSFAGRYLAGRTAIGLHLAAATPDRIVAVVADARERGADQSPVPTVYSCFSAGTPFPWFVVRTTGEPMALAGDVRRTINQLEPLRSVYDMAALDNRIGDANAQNRLRTLVLVLFACTALSLACLGVYGTLSYIVSLRRREVGLRLALGAARSGILRQFVAQGLRISAVACACGLAFSIAFARLLSGMLYGVTRFDPTTLASVVLVVLTVATLASLVPASRAAFMQPMRALREE
jgi:putative ABC transport system permease protein